MAPLVTTILFAYAGIGLAFAVAFAMRGAVALDHGASGAPLSFRLLLIPGAVGLWPILLWRWIGVVRRGTPRASRTP